MKFDIDKDNELFDKSNLSALERHDENRKKLWCDVVAATLSGGYTSSRFDNKYVGTAVGFADEILVQFDNRFKPR